MPNPPCQIPQNKIPTFHIPPKRKEKSILDAKHFSDFQHSGFQERK
jgi:hypothetical protein